MLDMQLNVMDCQYDYPELKLSLRDDTSLPNDTKQQYAILAKDILNDAFYSNQSSYINRISKEQQYAELVLKRLLDFDETPTERQVVINRISKLPDHVFILNALEEIKENNIAAPGFPQRETTEEDYERTTDALFDLLASLLINYFGKYKFGSRPEIMRAFSLLPPVIRRKVLMYLYNNPDKSSNITAQTGKKECCSHRQAGSRNFES